MGKRDLPDSNNVYYRSYLYKAGIRFNYSIVDSTVKKGFALSFYIAVLIFAACSLLGPKNILLGQVSLPFLLLSLLYIILYAARYFYFLQLRRRLRSQEKPILGEAYAVVLLDREYSLPLPAAVKLRTKRAVIYKECGTLKPRFFLGVASRRDIPGFVPGRLVQIFTDKQRAKYYSVDEDSAVRAMPATAPQLRALNMSSSISSSAQMRRPVEE